MLWFFTFSEQEYIKLLLDSLWVWDGKDHKPPTQIFKNKTNQKNNLILEHLECIWIMSENLDNIRQSKAMSNQASK